MYRGGRSFFFFFLGDFHSAAGGLEKGKVPWENAPFVKATSGHSLLGSFRVQVLCSTAPLLTRWPGVVMYGNDHRLCQMAFELVTSPCLESHFDRISLHVEWDRKECAGCVLTHAYLHTSGSVRVCTSSLVRAQDFYSCKGWRNFCLQ